MNRTRILGLVAALTAVAVYGCGDDEGPTEAEFPSEGEVFLDEYGSGVTFQAFLGSLLDAVQVDQTEVYEGTASLEVAVPAPGSMSGTYAGGAFTADVGRDLTEFDALTFWAKASTAATLDVVGIGNDNTETSEYIAERRELPLTTTWTQFVIPVPLASKLTAEDGLFFFAEGPEGASNTIWFDEVQYETLGTLTNPRPEMLGKAVDVTVGSTVDVEGLQVTYDVAGTDITVSAAPAYFTFSSSDESVATVSADGVITVVGDGNATITAALGSTDATGSVVVNTVNPPQTAAPTPTQDPADVISLFSNAYTNETVDTWSAEWDAADVEDVQIEGDDAKRYTNLSFAGIEFTSAPLDVSGMTRFHMDIWTPDPTADPAAFRVKLVDFGPNGVFDESGGDDSEHELTFTASTTPALATGSWVSIDVPMSAFANLTNQTAMAQLIISGDPNTVYVDNIYFYDDGGTGGGGGDTAPATAAPTPTQDAGDVISLFSDAYTDVAVDRFITTWSAATLTDTTVEGSAVKKYSGLDFAGVEFLDANSIDASGMTHVRMDVWTPDATSFSFKFVDAGADNTVGTGGDDSENALITFDASSTPALAQGGWVSLDVPLSDLTSAGLASLTNLSQLILVGQPTGAATVYVDNIYFYNDGSGSGGSTAPATAAPTPTEPEGDVISLFSDAYTDVAVDRFITTWSVATLADTTVEGSAVKKYSGLDFAGIEFLDANSIDASGMTHVRMDVWTPDATAFSFKFVDAGADNTVGAGGDDSENALIRFDGSSTPALAQGGWVSLDVPLSDLTSAGLASLTNLSQLIIVGEPTSAATVYVDNIYFYNDGGTGGATAPSVAAPTPPTRDAADVISLFSDAYTDVPVDRFITTWSVATLADTTVEGSAVKKYSGLDFAGIEFVDANSIDATGMTHIHMDVWTPDATSFSFKLVDFGADNAFDGGDDSENTLVTLDASSTPALATGSWVSIDVPLSDLTSSGLASLANLSQMILVGQPTSAATIYIDNIYFYR